METWVDFHYPLHYEDLELNQEDRFFIETGLTLEDLKTDSNEELNAISRNKLNWINCVDNTEFFNTNDEDYTILYYYVKYYAELNAEHKLVVLNTCITILNQVISSATTSHVPKSQEKVYLKHLKMITYLISQILINQNQIHLETQKKLLQKKATLDQEKKEATQVYLNALNALVPLFSREILTLWDMKIPAEEFVASIVQTLFALFENQVLLKDKAVKALVDVLFGHCIVHSHSNSNTITISYTLVNTIAASDAFVPFLVAFFTDFEQTDSNKAACCVVLNEMLTEINNLKSVKSSSTSNQTKMKNISLFLGSLPNSLIPIILTNLTLLLPLLNADSYHLRNGLVTCIMNILLADFYQQQDDANVNQKESILPKEAQTKTRDTLLQILQERVHDVNSFARSHVLKSWTALSENGAVPLSYYHKVTVLAIDRLVDRSVNVRKQALQLLSTLLMANPYLANLNRETLEKQLKEGEEYLKTHIVESVDDIEEEGRVDCDSDDEDQHNPKRIPVPEKEYLKAEKLFRFYSNALLFLRELQNSIPRILQLIRSKTSSDVCGALDFLTLAYAFNLFHFIASPNDAKEPLYTKDSILEQMFVLIWRESVADKPIRDKLMECFQELFVFVPGTDAKQTQPPEQVARNFVSLLERASFTQISCIEKIVQELIQQRALPGEFVDCLWEFIQVESGPETRADRSHAFCLLGMITSVKSSILDQEEELELILKYGIGKTTQRRNDWNTLRHAARTLQHVQIVPSTTKGQALEDSMSSLHISKDPENSPRMKSIKKCMVYLQKFLSLEVPQKPIENDRWFAAAEQAINALFHLCDRPEKICAAVIKDLSMKLLPVPTNSVDELDCDSSPICSPSDLGKFFFILGHVAIKLLVHTEKLAADVKRLRHEQSISKSSLKGQSKSTDDENQDPEEELEDELGMVAQLEAEEDDFLFELSEKEIVSRNLLGLYGPLLAHVVANQTEEFSDELLQEAATLSLCKFMSISSECCEAHLRLLFTKLKRTNKPTVRANLIIALGDLAFRFPNLIEPWISHLYTPLRDTNVKVRKTTLLTLSHLILNDMIKLKTQISDILVCLNDHESSIQDLAKLFFQELSKRGTNPIYNLLPDAISSLSETVSQKEFQSILHFLLQFIKKEKHVESLVEKLCLRFSQSDSLANWINLSYCLANLSFTSEKAFAKLIQMKKSYKTALAQNQRSYNHFKQILNKGRKLAKPTLEPMLDEFEKDIVAFYGGDEDAGTTLHASKTKPAKSKDDSSSEDEDIPMSTRKTRGQRNQTVIESSESDSE